MFADRKADRLTLPDFYSDRDDGRFGGKLLALQQPSVRGVGWIKKGAKYISQLSLSGSDWFKSRQCQISCFRAEVSEKISTFKNTVLSELFCPKWV